ncbi:MAG: class II fructose-bisphosphate aldolase family protein [Planctomycetes bacterium]|nr:class II fructose-bisphosphate aldolase family protein [Planctomycetota bacterium]
MELVTVKELMQEAHKSHYAVPAFNICNLETIQAVLEQAEHDSAPVIIQAHWSEAYYSSPRAVVEMVRSVGSNKRGVVAVHLDHGSSYEDAVRCVQGGFTGVMYDGSQLPVDENIAILQKVVELAGYAGVSVEGEIGTIGQTSETGEKLEKAYLTDPQEAGRLAAETGIDCLAVAIGNAHGFYAEKPELDFDRLREITNLVKIPLVLHGGTGIPKEQIQQSISMGVSKVNFSTALRETFIRGMRLHMEANPEELGLMNILAAGKNLMKQAVRDGIAMCLCQGKT